MRQIEMSMEGGPKRSGRSPRSGKKVSFAGEKALKAQAALEAAKKRETMKETLRKKLEFEQKALHIVERLLENEVADDFLIDCARFITPSNYRDALEERSILKICGYPVCPNKLGNVPKQQFKISTKTNKVYDITERKCFCSNFCYKASKHFEVQIPKTPVWLREEERPPDVRLLKKGESGSSGEEVRISDQPISESEIENPQPTDTAHSTLSASGTESEGSDQEQDFVSSVLTGGGAEPKCRTGILKHGGEGERNTARALTDVSDQEKDRGAAQEQTAETTGNEGGDTRAERDERTDRDGLQQPASEVGEDSSRARPVTDGLEQAAEAAADRLSACRIGGRDARADSGAQNGDCAPTPGLNITQVGVSRRGAAELRNLLNAQAKDPVAALRTSLLEHLTKTLKEWRTEETMRLLHGPAYRPREGDQSGVEVEEEELDEDDLEESLEVPASHIQSRGGQERPSATAPDYDTLQSEAELQNVRVREFYRGSFVLPEELNTDPEDTSGWDPALPLVDSHAQHLIQKRIVSEKLNRSLRDIVGPLNLTMNDISTDINNLIRTFRFTNANIIHKSPEWTLIAVVLLSVLSDVISLLQRSLKRPSAVQYISTLMGEMRLTDHDLLSLVQLFRAQPN